MSTFSNKKDIKAFRRFFCFIFMKQSETNVTPKTPNFSNVKNVTLDVVRKVIMIDIY
jgi:hypothetical protein